LPIHPAERDTGRRRAAMASTRFDCDCDKVIEMEELGIGTEEILQYARALLPKDDLRTLMRGLEEILAASAENGPETGPSGV
jgi:hypothetical protein